MNEDFTIPVPSEKPETPEWFPLVNEDTVSFTEEHERPVPHFYKDTEDKITVGTGFNVHNSPKAAYDLGLYWAEGEDPTDRRATQKAIEQAFEQIKPLPKGEYYTFYDPASSENKEKGLLNIRMRDDAMRYAVEEKLKQSEKELQNKFPGFNTFPYPARKALLDMQYNIGDTRFKERFIDKDGKEKGWPNLFSAIDARDWNAAAKASRRGQIGEGRNEDIKKLFEEAYRIEQKRKR
ncbi:MAG: hypothetical protein GC137_06775 [Alphaproteobacteria bacterium]|nr:hypothetical protein [Alphaproteobacteria bacterium]